MDHTVFALHDEWIFILLIIGFVFVADETFASFHPPDDGEGLAPVLRQCNRHRAAKTGPCSLSGYGIRRAGGVVGDGNASAGQFGGADAGIVVGQRCGNRLAPGIAIVKRFAAVNPVCFPVSHESHQVSRLQLYHIGMYMTVALRHHHQFPGFSLVVGDAESAGIAGQSVGGIRAKPVAKDPASVGKDLNRLAAEGHCGELHIVFPFLAVQLGGVHGPYRIIRTVEERRILFASGGISGDVHRRKPCGSVLGKQ